MLQFNFRFFKSEYINRTQKDIIREEKVIERMYLNSKNLSLKFAHYIKIPEFSLVKFLNTQKY